MIVPWEGSGPVVIAVATTVALVVAVMAGIWRRRLGIVAAARLAAERARRDSERRFRLLVDNSADMIGVVRSARVLVSLSPSARTILGREPDSLVGTSMANLIHPDDVARVEQTTDDLGPRPFGPVVARSQRVDGSWVWLEWTGRLLLDDDGKVTGACVTGRDITDRRQALRDLAEAREQAVTRRGTSLSSWPP